MMIDCDACAARGPACGDCVVTYLLGAPPADRPGHGENLIDLDGHEQAAIAVLAGSGLVPPLRLVAVASPARGARPEPGRPTEEHAHDERPDGSRRAAV
jgi:hypothetical protein